MSQFDFRDWSDYPEECYNIKPGCAVVFIPMDADEYYNSNDARHNSMYMEKFASCYNFGFRISISFVKTNDPRLVNRIVARRINFGSFDSYSVITADFSNYRNIEAFAAEYFNLSSSDSERVKFIQFDHTLNGMSFHGRMRAMPIDGEDEEETFIRSLEYDKENILEDISRKIADFCFRSHTFPSPSEIRQIINGKIQFGDSPLSPIQVDNNLKVLLPGFDNVELPFSALQKTLYFLFLRHPEGIVLANLCDYRSELEDIYGLVIPNREVDLARTTMDLLTDPVNNESLRQQISKIKRIVKAKISNDSIAEKYYITGERGYAYSIHIDSNMITMPRALSR